MGSLGARVGAFSDRGSVAAHDVAASWREGAGRGRGRGRLGLGVSHVNVRERLKFKHVLTVRCRKTKPQRKRTKKGEAQFEQANSPLSEQGETTGPRVPCVKNFVVVN